MNVWPSILACLLAACSGRGADHGLATGKSDAAAIDGSASAATDATPLVCDPEAGGDEVALFCNTDGTFMWTPSVKFERDWVEIAAHLDLTSPAGSQTGEGATSRIHFFVWEPSDLSTPGGFYFQGCCSSEDAELAAELAAGDDVVWEGPYDSDDADDVTIVPPLTKMSGDTIGPDDRWVRGVPIEDYLYRAGLQTAHFQDPGSTTGPNHIVWTAGIVGVKFQLGDGVHYGFVELAWQPGEGHPELSRYLAVRWGYQLEPDVPLVVPP